MSMDYSVRWTGRPWGNPLERIANALERIAEAMESQSQADYEEPESFGTLDD